MTTTRPQAYFDSNQYATDTACEYCQGNSHHEFWCITQNIEVLKAWQAVLNPAKLSLHDELILHALGVAWVNGRQEAHRTRLAVH